MKKLLIAASLLLHSFSASAHPARDRLTRAMRAGEPVVVHVSVALADNRYQGIVPVPEAIGNGQDPARNLYWGARYGLKTYFLKDEKWTLLSSSPNPASGILERLVLKKEFHLSGQPRPVSVYLIADAWDGREIQATVRAFLEMSAGQRRESVEFKGLKLAAGSDAHLLGFIGHNGLMDFSAPALAAPSGHSPQSAFVLACMSRPYFLDALRNAQAEPVLLTEQLMAPEAYSFAAMLKPWLEGRSPEVIREAAAAAYGRYQKLGPKAARGVFSDLE